MGSSSHAKPQKGGRRSPLNLHRGTPGQQSADLPCDWGTGEGGLAQGPPITWGLGLLPRPPGSLATTSGRSLCLVETSSLQDTRSMRNTP